MSDDYDVVQKVTDAFLRRRAERMANEEPPDREFPPDDAYCNDVWVNSINKAPERDLILTQFTLNELITKPPSPVFVIKDYLPQDVFIRNGTGGTGKSTLTLQEYIHIILGKALWGMEILIPGPVVLITAEDDRERILWRLFNIAEAMELSNKEKQKIADDFYVIDLSGECERLATLDSKGNITTSTLADRVIDLLKEIQPVVINFDPLVKFSPGERFVNDAEDAVITSAMRIKRQLKCAVGFTHHVSKIVMRDNVIDHHSGRGGSALGDGARAAYQLVTISEACAEKYGCASLADDINEGRLLAYHITKLSDAPKRSDPFILRRKGWLFEPAEAMPEQDKSKKIEEMRQAKLMAAVDKLKRYLFKNTARLTHKDLEALCDDIGLSRNAVRSAVAKGIADRIFYLADLPQEEQRGGKKTYIAVRS